MSLICQKCLSGRTGDVLGGKCQTPNCDGIIERAPEWRELVDSLTEPMTCPSRVREQGPWERKEGLDHWEKFKAAHGNRVCSFCGSLHPDDMFELVKQSAEAPENAVDGSVVEIDPSDKSYKIYVRQPGVRNAHEGGIKFYTWHLPHDKDGKLVVTQQQQDEYGQAVRRSRDRFDRRLYGRPGVKES